MSRTEDVLARLDIQQEYQKLGITGFKGQPNKRGWLSCNAYGENQKTGSAGINVGNGEGRGYYHDFRTNEHVSLWDFAAQYGGFKDWKDAAKHYAQQVGITLRGRAAKLASDQFDFCDWSDALAVRYCTNRKPGISPEAMKRAGVRFARWPAKSHSPQLVFACPIFGPNLTGGPAVGWLAFPRIQSHIEIFKKGSEPTLAKTITPRNEGAIPTWAGFDCHYMDDAEVIWKVEGITDMLALMSAIPSELHGKHVVVTNPNGSNETPKPDQLDSLAGKVVYVVHDADAPGEEGAVRWGNAIAQVAAECRILRLPYPLEPKHGKDLRDWICEGVSYQAILAAARSSEAVKPEHATHEEMGGGEIKGKDIFFKEVLAQLNLDVLGQDDEDRIYLYSKALRKRSVVESKELAGLSHLRLVQIAGPVAFETVRSPLDNSADKLDMPEVRYAIMMQATHEGVVNPAREVGMGVWRGQTSSGQPTRTVILVNDKSAARYNGDQVLQLVETPRVDGRLLQFADSNWYDHEALAKYVEEAQSPEWRIDVMATARKIFSLWKWQNPSQDPTVMTGLVLATWVGTMMPWRPLVAITGSSNCGKSTLIERVIEPLFGGKERGLCSSSADATEAGIRQGLGQTGRFPIIDEFDKNIHRSKILEAFRATSRQGGISLRGTATGRGRSLQLRQIPWVSGIELGLNQEADRNRAIELEILKVDDADSGVIPVPPEEEMTDLGLKLLAIATVTCMHALEMFPKLLKLHVDGVNARTIESYSVPMSMVAAAYGLDESTGEPQALLEQFLAPVSEAQLRDKIERDEIEFLADILRATIDLGKGERKAVMSCMTDVSSRDFNEELERHGVAQIIGRNSAGVRVIEHVFVTNDVVKILQRTRWENLKQVGRVLSRIPGAELGKHTLCGVRTRGTKIPWSVVSELAGEMSDDEFNATGGF